MNSQILKLHLSLEDSCAGKIKRNEKPTQILNYISFSNRDQALKRMECTNIINVNRWFQNSHKLYFYLKGSGHHQCSCSLPLCCRPNGELSNQKLLPSHKHTHTHTDKHTHTKTHTQTHTQTHAHTMVSNQKLLPSHSLFDPETQNQPRSHPATHPTNFVVSSPMMIKELTKHLCLFITVSRYITCYEGQREKFNLTYYKTDC